MVSTQQIIIDSGSDCYNARYVILRVLAVSEQQNPRFQVSCHLTIMKITITKVYIAHHSEPQLGYTAEPASARPSSTGMKEPLRMISQGSSFLLLLIRTIFLYIYFLISVLLSLYLFSVSKKCTIFSSGKQRHLIMGKGINTTYFSCKIFAKPLKHTCV